MALPCFVFFSMAEMVVPDTAKPACKVIKWLGAEVFDRMTSPIEKHIFGYPIPADLPTFTGTLPSELNFKTVVDLVNEGKQKFVQLPSQAMKKTYGRIGELDNVPLRDVLNYEAQQQVLQNLQETTLDQSAAIVENAFTSTP